MTTRNAEDQQAWRERQIAEGRKPRTFYLKENSLALLAQQARQGGENQHHTLDQLIQGAAQIESTLPSSWDASQPISGTNRPPGNFTQGELDQLAHHQKETVVHTQMTREAAMNGGAAPEGQLTQKQRVENAFLAGNMHRQGK